jgi:hypothetical protein
MGESSGNTAVAGWVEIAAAGRAGNRGARSEEASGGEMLETAIVMFATYNEQLRWGFRREGKCENSKPGSLYARKREEKEEEKG